MHIKCCSQLSFFLWTSQSTSRWEIIKVLIKLASHASVGTFLFCKLFPLQPEDAPTKEGFFKRTFFWLHLGFYDFRQTRAEEVIYEREYCSSSIFAFYKGVSLVLDSPPMPLRGRESLLPFDEIYGAVRVLWDWSWLRQLALWIWALYLQEVLSLHFSLTNLSCLKVINL